MLHHDTYKTIRRSPGDCQVVHRMRRIPVNAGTWADRVLHARAGTIAIKFAVVAPVLLLLIGNIVDYTRYVSARTAVQSAADAASLAAAKEVSLTDSKRHSLYEVAKSIAKNEVSGRDRVSHGQEPQIKTEVRDDPLEVDVVVTMPFEPMFGMDFGLQADTVEARSVARIVGQPNICVLGLNDDENGTISLEQNARVTGENCAVYSNSTSKNGIKSKNSAKLAATFICSAGGAQRDGNNFDPAPLTDCPTFEDPLSARVEPDVEDCDPTIPSVIDQDMTLDPGTYCGLDIMNGAKVTLRGDGDGVFVIKDNPLRVRDGGSLVGEGVGLYFSGDDAYFEFEQDSHIDLAAPQTGPLAGLLVFAGRNQDDSLSYKIESDDARRLIGTIYIPQGELRIDATSPIADQSAYTAIVADTMRLYGGPHLVLNTNYSETDVPVPDGIKGTGQPARLAR
ncbi:MAG: TadE/TadG family type IV pilus assembly protein [Hyphomicrobium sp.]|nr:TadE/TadG family type IV pilus assembly protein [Hyphomicrobium sp.]